MKCSHARKDCHSKTSPRKGRLMDGVGGRSDVRKNRKQFLLYACGFFLNFSAYVSVRNLQSSVNIEGGLGTITVAITYSVCALVSIFCTPIMLRTLGPKKCLLFSEFTYVAYVFANLYPEFYTLIPVAVLLGVGEAVMWTSVSLLNVYYAVQYAGARKHPTKEDVFYVNMHSGYFFTAMQGCQVFGNLITYIILYAFTPDSTEDTEEETTVAATMTSSAPVNWYQFCGANDCQDQDAIDDSIDQYVPTSKTTTIILFSILAAFCVVGQVLHYLFLPVHAFRSENIGDVDKENIDDTPSEDTASSSSQVPGCFFIQGNTYLKGDIAIESANKGSDNFAFALEDKSSINPVVLHCLFLPGHDYRNGGMTIEDVAKGNTCAYDGSTLKEISSSGPGVPPCLFLSGQTNSNGDVAIKDSTKGNQNYAYDDVSSEAASSSSAPVTKDHGSVEPEAKSKEYGEYPGFWSQYRTALKQTFIQVKDARQILLAPMCFYVGFFEGFVYSELTRAYSSCVMGVATIGLCMAAYGLSDAILSWVVGRLGAKWGRTPFFIFSTFLDVGTFSYCLFWNPNPESSWTIYLVFFALGVTDGIWQTMLNVAHLEYFESNQDVAITIWNFYITIALAIQFGWSTSLCVDVKIYVQFFLLAFSLICYGFAERIHRRKRNPAVTLEKTHL